MGPAADLYVIPHGSLGDGYSRSSVKSRNRSMNYSMLTVAIISVLCNCTGIKISVKISVPSENLQSLHPAAALLARYTRSSSGSQTPSSRGVSHRQDQSPYFLAEAV